MFKEYTMSIVIGSQVALISPKVYQDIIIAAESDAGLISTYKNKYDAFRLATGKVEGTVQSVTSSFVTLKEMENIKFPISTVTEIISNIGGTSKMIGSANNTSVVSTMVQANKKAATVAAKVTGGKVALKVVKDKIAPMLPMMLRGYVDTPLGDVIIANIAIMANKYTNGQYKVLGVAAEAMTEAAYAQFFESFKLDEMLADLEAKLAKSGIVTDTDGE